MVFGREIDSMDKNATNAGNLDWSDFEENVRKLLTLQGWAITPEHILGPKKVDAYAEKLVEFNQQTKIAIECKYFGKPLTKTNLVSIYTDYRPLIDSNLIDSILLVTANGLAPAAMTFSKSAKGLIHITYLGVCRITSNSFNSFGHFISGGLIF
jgi:hypothetical protein